MEDAPGLERRLFEHLVLDLAVDVSRGLLDVERVAVTTTLGSHYHSASCVLVALESCRDILERDVPELLLLLTLRIAVEDFKKVATLCDLPVSVGVRDLSEVLHETEVGAHLVGESRHLAELRNQGDLGTGLPVLVNEQGLVGLGDVLVVAGLVVLLVRDLSTRLVESGVWALSKVDSLNAVGLLVVPGDHGRSFESLLELCLGVTTSLLNLLTKLVHVLEN